MEPVTTEIFIQYMDAMVPYFKLFIMTQGLLIGAVLGLAVWMLVRHG